MVADCEAEKKNTGGYPGFQTASLWVIRLVEISGSTISTLLHDKINPKDCQVLSLGDSGFLQFLRVVSSDYCKPRISKFKILISTLHI